MYLAVKPELKNQNYGSKILMDLKEKYEIIDDNVKMIYTKYNK